MKNTITAISLLALVCLAGAQTPPAILVNGVISILGDRRVAFTTDPGTATAKDFMLAEGESRLGIRLVSVDIRSATAIFDNHGTRQKISICATPNLITPEAAVDLRPTEERVAAGRGSGSAAQSTAAAARQPERAGQFVNGIYAGRAPARRQRARSQTQPSLIRPRIPAQARAFKPASSPTHGGIPALRRWRRPGWPPLRLCDVARRSPSL